MWRAIRATLRGEVHPGSADVLLVSRRYQRTVLPYLTLRKLKNLARIYLQRRRRAEHVTAAPAVLRLEPTNACNLRCPGCITGLRQNPNRNAALTLQQARALIDAVREDAVFVRLDGMGEPLLNPRLPDIVAYAHARGLGTVASANLNIAPEARLLRLVRSGLDHLIVSCDGASQDVYEKYRRGGQLETVLDNIRTLVRLREQLGLRNPWIEFQFIEFEHSRHEVDAARALAMEAGADRFVSFPSRIVSFPDYAAWKERDLADWVLVRRGGSFSPCHHLYVTSTIRSDGQATTCCEGLATGFSRGDAVTDTDVRNDEVYRWLRRMYRTDDAFVVPETGFAQGSGAALSEALCMDCGRFPYVWRRRDELTEHELSRVVVV